MLRNYLITALRNFGRHKLYSFINIAGLTVGLACAIFIILFINDELSFDSWIPDTQNVYRVESTFYLPGRGENDFAQTPIPVPPAMKAHIPGVVAYTHLYTELTTSVVGNRQFLGTLDMVDPNFLSMIKLPLVEGDPKTALSQPDSAVLSQAVAKQYFGDENPIGKTFGIARTFTVRVTGVLKDLPHNTQFDLNILMPDTSKADVYGNDIKKSWLNIIGYGFVKLAPGTDPKTVVAKFKPILDQNIDAKKEMDLNMAGSDVLKVHLTRLRDVHLASQFEGGMTPVGSRATLYGFAAVAALILLIACFNFMNLATARAMMRAREVSLRKVVGAKRRELIVQFMGESVLTALVALVLAFSLVEILTPAYDSFLGRPIALHYLQSWPLTLSIIAIAIGAGLVGGIYPALVLSGFRPASTLNANASGRGGSGRLRAALVVLQFAISIGLGISAIVIFTQIRYARRMDLGFNRHNVLAITDAAALTSSKRNALAQALAAEPSIAGTAVSSQVPFDGSISVSSVRVPGGTQTYLMPMMQMSPDFPAVYDMKLLAGRNLSRDRGTDITPNSSAGNANSGNNNKVTNIVTNVVINAAAARKFGFTPASAIGKTIISGQDNTRQKIVGVFANTKFDGLKILAQPFVFQYAPDAFAQDISIRVKPGQTQAALAAITRLWHRFAPDVAIQRHFIDESFDKLFAADQQEGEMFGIFVGIAIFIACLGLFGLAAFTAERRTKSIGVRKVFGARTRDILGLLLWQFSIPVLIANVIAWPIAWYYLHGWLEGYAYRIALNPAYFIAASLIALVIAWATIFAHALRVARANPIHALRYE